MCLKQIVLQNFRNYKMRKFTFDPCVNALIGPNGIGKTSLLEALSVISIGRSFRTHRLKDLIHTDTDQFYIEATFTKHEVEQTLSFRYGTSSKALQHNQTPYNHHAPLLGLLPSIILSNSDRYLIEGAPHERRRFLNVHLAQKDAQYTTHLQRYVQALKQRNALLKQRVVRGIEPFEEVMSQSATYIQKARSTCIDNICTHLPEEYTKLIQNSVEEVPSMHYHPSPFHYEEQRAKDMEYQHTRYGPHRDDWTLALNQQPAKTFASEGQKQCLIYSLRLVECQMLEGAFLGIDDFAAHLDNSRQERLIERLHSLHQIFLTSPVPCGLDALVLQ